ncbi:hypothetical protein [Plantactinospora soyae]|uniref:Uncharacterized protein n=1 Tax=Plantactinospora soyae TaxID=1544732 RepID=A0A927MCA6_9ACTN|nr:hypothetical protein [Plantactinospora soyae]MBE1491097.1 hypothetical protein [Plantactinospora soyae]
MTESTVALPDAGSVSASYRQQTKVVAPAAGLSLPGAALKWYDIHGTDQTIADGVRAEARDFLRAEAEGTGLDLRNELGFVILHRCGESFHFLLVSTWRGNNELWETVYARDGGPFQPFPQPGTHRGTFCVWELAAVLHEQQAWIRYLRSTRDDAARQAYLADQYAGPVG